jgi:hypothetical protein
MTLTAGGGGRGGGEGKVIACGLRATRRGHRRGLRLAAGEKSTTTVCPWPESPHEGTAARGGAQSVRRANDSPSPSPAELYARRVRPQHEQGAGASLNTRGNSCSSLHRSHLQASSEVACVRRWTQNTESDLATGTELPSLPNGTLRRARGPSRSRRAGGVWLIVLSSRDCGVRAVCGVWKWFFANGCFAPTPRPPPLPSLEGPRQARLQGPPALRRLVLDVVEE